MYLRDDMPYLNDTRRFIRIAFVLDELRRIVKSGKNNIDNPSSFYMSRSDFVTLGGRHTGSRQKFSFYRTLVLAHRDIHAYVKEHRLPLSRTIKQARSIYNFYPSDDETVDVQVHTVLPSVLSMCLFMCCVLNWYVGG